MRRGRLALVGALLVTALMAVSAGVAPATTSPSATATRVLVGSPATVACGGSLPVEVTITGHAGTSDPATDVMLVLDLSGSMAGQKRTDLENAATAVLDALDAVDGTANHAIVGNRAGIVTYNGSSGTVARALGSTYDDLAATVAGLSSPSGASPHDKGIEAAVSALSASTHPRAIVLITDGQTPPDASGAATLAKNPPNNIVIASIGIGGDANESGLEAWASSPTYYQYGSSEDGIDGVKLVSDIGATPVSVPASFTLTETLGQSFAAASATASKGTVTSGTGTLVWTATLADGESATLDYTALRNGDDVFSVTNETVSSGALSVTGGSATIAPMSLAIDVLPCGGTELAPPVDCTGASCMTSGTQGGVSYSLDAGTPPAGTDLFLTGLSVPPPAGVCPGFDAKTNGVQFDIRPLTGDATFQLVIPKTALGGKKWWQTDVCMGTNMRFITAIGSLSNLRPGAKLRGGGALPSRWWGLLPSIPRYTFVSGLGFVRGPWITSRRVDAAGNAVVNVKVPYVGGSDAFTTDGKAAYDPKLWG